MTYKMLSIDPLLNVVTQRETDMTSQSSHRLLARLSQDLAELRDSPYPGVAVFTDDADLRKLCLVLTPPSGPWKDLALHFDVVLPGDWVRLHFEPWMRDFTKRVVTANVPPSGVDEC